MSERIASDLLARARIQGRTADILMSEIGHDLDEIVTGLSQKDDALTDVGLGDARRDLEELNTLLAVIETRLEEMEGAACASD